MSIIFDAPVFIPAHMIRKASHENSVSLVHDLFRIGQGTSFQLIRSSQGKYAWGIWEEFPLLRRGDLSSSFGHYDVWV